MNFVSIRMITDDLERVVQFYEQVTGIEAVRSTPVFAELKMPSCTLAFGHADNSAVRGGLRACCGQPQSDRRVPRRRRRQRVRAAQAAGHRVGTEADHHALGKPLHLVPRSRRQPRQLPACRKATVQRGTANRAGARACGRP